MIRQACEEFHVCYKVHKMRVVGLGDPIQDLVIHLTRFPSPNQNIRMENYCFQGGGNVATAMVTCARLGMEAYLIGAVGGDFLGDLILSDLKYNGVVTDYVRMEPGKKSHFCICATEQDIGSKEFISKPGTFSPVSLISKDRNLIKSAQALHIGGFTEEIAKACDWIHEAGGIVSIDAAYYKPDIYENYRLIDLFIASETYYREMCRQEGWLAETPGCFMKAVRQIQAQGPDVVIFTFGAEGCRGVCGDDYIEMPSYPVAAADTTGAGDVFHGAFLYAWLQKMNAAACCRFASAASAIKCTRIGGRSGIPTLSVLEHFMNAGIIEGEELDQRMNHYLNEV